MNISIDERGETLIDSLVRSGRYGSARDVVEEGLRLVREREEKLDALRATIDASIARGGSLTSEEVSARIDAALDEWERTKKAIAR